MEEKHLLSRGASDTPTRMVCSGYHTFRRTGMYSSLAKLSTNCLTSKFPRVILQVGHKNTAKMWPTAAISPTRPQNPPSGVADSSFFADPATNKASGVADPRHFTDPATKTAENVAGAVVFGNFYSMCYICRP